MNAIESADAGAWSTTGGGERYRAHHTQLPWQSRVPWWLNMLVYFRLRVVYR